MYSCISDTLSDESFFFIWSVTQADRKRLEAMEMCIWRRMEKISWVDKISYEEVLQRVNETKTLDIVRKCKRVVWACAIVLRLHHYCVV